MLLGCTSSLGPVPWWEHTWTLLFGEGWCPASWGGLGPKGPLPLTPRSWWAQRGHTPTPFPHVLMLGGSVPGSGVLLSPSQAARCSGATSLRISSRPLAMAEIFSFWAAARFSRKRALRDRGSRQLGAPGGRGGGDGQTTPHGTTQQAPHGPGPAPKPPAPAAPQQGPSMPLSCLQALQRDG